eukprot:gnl/Spiro4/13905_TR7436_c0_g1_i1.p1 gnl/Spiro4/13905_TR7436_c0_g1~~gnl/Spiro4/13905_TR7436_c0_g1_i1.p1  ORF type:complete len:137 (-),score=30.70 gnl/Spiro4/13905_TR7436_c0_g1_i1:86-463(-)
MVGRPQLCLLALVCCVAFCGAMNRPYDMGDICAQCTRFFNYFKTHRFLTPLSEVTTNYCTTLLNAGETEHDIFLCDKVFKHLTLDVASRSKVNQFLRQGCGDGLDCAAEKACRILEFAPAHSYCV